MSDRALLTMGATMDDAEVDARIKEKQQALEDLKNQAAATDQVMDASQRNAALILQDIAMMADLGFQVLGLNLSAGAQAAIGMVSTSAMAYRHVMELYATHPYFAPIAATMYAASIAMQLNALREINDATDKSMEALRASQFAATLALRYGT
jgi:hypothetical protein